MSINSLSDLTPDDITKFNSLVPSKPEDGGCWPWKGPTNSKRGYGNVSLKNGQTVGAHRVAYVIGKGSISPGLEVDHICRQRSCVRPSHLQLVTRSEHVKLTYRRNGGHRKVKSHCRKGHEFSEENTHIYMRPGSVRCRVCKACDRERDKRRRDEARKLKSAERTSVLKG